ncbi:hypothetical protein CLV96_2671 [Leptospira meyeri]|uniref:Uncharacterized protein n=1 Tax=Leptospira meyeri TaxID=29508 RepID=A0A4R8N2V5_LEPME|nr:hypothetical protein CLV96_2671 [Leptospira meyeri]
MTLPSWSCVNEDKNGQYDRWYILLLSGKFPLALEENLISDATKSLIDELIETLVI